MIEDGETVRPGRTLATLGVLAAAVGLTLLPALVALGVAPPAMTPVALGLGGVVAVWGGVKLAAAILGALRYVTSPLGRVAAASID